MNNELFVELCKKNKRTVQEIGLKLTEELGEVIAGQSISKSDNGEEYREELVDLYMIAESLRIKLNLEESQKDSGVELSQDPLLQLIQLIGLINEAILAKGGSSGSEYKAKKEDDSMTSLVNHLIRLIKEQFDNSIEHALPTKNTFENILKVKSEKWAKVTGFSTLNIF